jgi:hypothetical protein
MTGSSNTLQWSRCHNNWEHDSNRHHSCDWHLLHRSRLPTHFGGWWLSLQPGTLQDKTHIIIQPFVARSREQARGPQGPPTIKLPTWHHLFHQSAGHSWSRHFLLCRQPSCQHKMSIWSNVLNLWQSINLTACRIRPSSQLSQLCISQLDRLPVQPQSPMTTHLSTYLDCVLWPHISSCCCSQVSLKLVHFNWSFTHHSVHSTGPIHPSRSPMTDDHRQICKCLCHQLNIVRIHPSCHHIAACSIQSSLVSRPSMQIIAIPIALNRHRFHAQTCEDQRRLDLILAGRRQTSVHNSSDSFESWQLFRSSCTFCILPRQNKVFMRF